MLEKLNALNANTLPVLIDAGQDKYDLMLSLLAQGKAELAKTLVGPIYETFIHLVLHNKDGEIRRFIPLITSGREELAQACEDGNKRLANALVAAGVDPTDSCRFSGSANAMRMLTELGADPSRLLALAVIWANHDFIQRLLLLGADVEAALNHATLAHNSLAIQRLTAMGNTL